MILSAHQPAYLPWLGYFDKIVQSDIFVYLDTVQFEKNSFINRNKIKTSQGALWLTVPVKSKNHLNSSLQELQIDNSLPWKKNHLKTIYANYKKAPRFDECYMKLERIFEEEAELFSDFCFRFLQFWMDELQIKRSIIRSQSLDINSKKSDLVLDLCKHFQVDNYLSGALGRNYIDEASFEEANVKLSYQSYNHPTYPQLWGEFTPYMSVLDFWMNTNDLGLIKGDEN
jgi:hypothetical protein